MNDLYTSVGEIFRPQFSNEEYAYYPSKAWDKAPSTVDTIEEAEVLSDSKTKVLHLEEWVYEDVAKQFSRFVEDGCEDDDYKCKIVRDARIVIEDDCDDHSFTYELTITAYIYYKEFSAPDGRWSEISDISPLWVECHSYEGENYDERLNDFSIDEFKRYII